MAISEKTFNKLSNLQKFDELKFIALEREGATVPVFAFVYIKNGLPGRMSTGLIQANKLWDQNDSRPSGYLVADNFDNESLSASVLVHEDWLDDNNLFDSKNLWFEKNIKHVEEGDTEV